MTALVQRYPQKEEKDEARATLENVAIVALCRGWRLGIQNNRRNAENIPLKSSNTNCTSTQPPYVLIGSISF